MTSEDNGNVSFSKPTPGSTEDLSEYTDADESMSAPTEFLAEFLTAVMMKEYENALKYCKLILQYEPNNATAKEFYPVIIEKLKQNEFYTSSENESDAASSSHSSTTSSTSEDSSDEQDDDDDNDEEEEENDKNKNIGNDNGSSSSDNTTGSYSSLEDDEAIIDQLAAFTAKFKIDNDTLENGNKIYESSPTLDSPSAMTENKPTFASSDSESPTDPKTLETIAMLRSRVVPN